MPRVAVLCWEESRPWVSALRQMGFSVPWVEEPKGDVHRRVTGVQPDVLVVDLTRLPEQGRGMVQTLAAEGALKDVPVVLVSQRDDDSEALKSMIQDLTVTTPTEMLSAVKSVLSGR
jgi:DNA-binding response OmpR family regulator